MTKGEQPLNRVNTKSSSLDPLVRSGPWFIGPVSSTPLSGLGVWGFWGFWVYGLGA